MTATAFATTADDAIGHERRSACAEAIAQLADDTMPPGERLAAARVVMWVSFARQARIAGIRVDPAAVVV